MDKEKFWERQYRRNVGRIIAVCYRYVNDRAVAEDLAQDVFVKAMEKFTTIRAIGRFDAWLTHIAVNHCIDHLRRQPDFVPLESDNMTEITTEENEHVWTAELTEEELLEAIGQLPEIQRTVFNLHALERYSHRRISGMLGISADNVRQLHHRARERLNQMLTAQYKEKEKRKKRLFMIILFASLKRAHANPRRIDRLYRSRLSGLRMEPATADPWSVVRANHGSPPPTESATESAAHASAASPGKIATAIAAHKTAILLVAAAGIAGITGGIVWWQTGRNTASGTDSGNGPAVVTHDSVVETHGPVVGTHGRASLQTDILDVFVVGGNNDSSIQTTTDKHSVATTKRTASPSSHPRNIDTHTSATPKRQESVTVPVTIPTPDTIPFVTPVVITKKNPVHQTVVIRDTTTISDTIFLNYDE